MLENIKGLIVFYVNVYPDLGQQIELTVQLVKEMNKPLINKVKGAGYLCMFVPTTKEATRVEKVDYDAPFPRGVAGTTEVEWQSLTYEIKPSYSFLGDKPKQELLGIINLYINFHPEMKIDHDKFIEAVKSLNEDVFQQVSEDGRYELMIVPTTKEATRMEKVDFNAPFPRFVPKSIKAKLVLLPSEDDVEDEEDEPQEETS